MKYGACGGETVLNVGSKTPNLTTSKGPDHSYTFQVGDKITKTLLAVSKICEKGKMVIFGPGPEYKSYIVHDPSCVGLKAGTLTEVISLENGTYFFAVR